MKKIKEKIIKWWKLYICDRMPPDLEHLDDGR